MVRFAFTTCLFLLQNVGTHILRTSTTSVLFPQRPFLPAILCDSSEPCGQAAFWCSDGPWPRGRFSWAGWKGTIGFRDSTSEHLKVRGPSSRTIDYFSLSVPFQSSKLPGSGPNLSSLNRFHIDQSVLAISIWKMGPAPRDCELFKSMARFLGLAPDKALIWDWIPSYSNRSSTMRACSDSRQ